MMMKRMLLTVQTGNRVTKMTMNQIWNRVKQMMMKLKMIDSVASRCRSSGVPQCDSVCERGRES